MNRMWRVFDRWVDSGPFRPTDLGRFRIVYAAALLLMLPSPVWVAAYPQSLFSPPTGPLQLLPGIPAAELLVLLDVLLAGALVALLLGIATTAASVVTGVALLTGYGVSFSLGKIDHTVFVVLVPLVLAAARWGDAVSIDALRRRSSDVPHATPQWPLRLLALLVGLSFLTAALPKLLNGWLDPNTQAVRAYALSAGESPLVPVEALLWLPHAVWECMDWATVVFEVGLLLAVLHWGSFRAALALATVFHLSVHLMLGILFEMNLVAYAAFLAWGSLPLPALPPRLARALEPVVRCLVTRTGAAAVTAVTAIGAVALVDEVGTAKDLLAPFLVWGGAAVGAAYLVGRARLLLRDAAELRRPAVHAFDAPLPRRPGERTEVTHHTIEERQG